MRLVEQPYAPASALEDLTTAIAVLRTPGVDGRGPRVETIQVGTPSLIGRGIPRISAIPREGKADSQRDGGMPQKAEQVAEAAIPARLPSAEPEQVDEDLARVLDRLKRDGEVDDEGCRLWPASGVNNDGYAKTTIKGRSVTVHKWLYEREHGAVPKGWTLEHLCHTAARLRGECPGGKCKHRRCCELAHLEAMPKEEHSSRTLHGQGDA